MFDCLLRKSQKYGFLEKSKNEALKIIQTLEEIKLISNSMFVPFNDLSRITNLFSLIVIKKLEKQYYEMT